MKRENFKAKVMKVVDFQFLTNSDCRLRSHVRIVTNHHWSRRELDILKLVAIPKYRWADDKTYRMSANLWRSDQKRKRSIKQSRKRTYEINVTC